MALTEDNDQFGVLADDLTLGARFRGVRAMQQRFMPRPRVTTTGPVNQPGPRANWIAQRKAEQVQRAAIRHARHDARRAAHVTSRLAHRSAWAARRGWVGGPPSVATIPTASGPTLNNQAPFLCEAYDQPPFAAMPYDDVQFAGVFSKLKKRFKAVAQTVKKNVKRVSKIARKVASAGVAGVTGGRLLLYKGSLTDKEKKRFRSIGKITTIAAGLVGAAVFGPALISGLAGKIGVGAGKFGGILAKLKSLRKSAGLPPISASSLSEETQAVQAEAESQGTPITEDEALNRASQNLQERYAPGSPDTAAEGERAMAEMIPAERVAADAATLPADKAPEAVAASLAGAKPQMFQAGAAKWIVIALAAGAIYSMMKQKRGMRVHQA